MTEGLYAAIILAGGFSSRMGRFKPLLPLGGRTISDRLISTFRQNGVEPFLVAGYREGELLAGLESRGIRVVENPDYASGMFSSIRAGIRAARNDGRRGAFIAPVDVPLVRPFTLARMLASIQENPRRILYPLFEKKRGHPPFIPEQKFGPILDWPGDGNLQAALQTMEGDAGEIEVPDRFIHCDLDTPADYERLCQDFQVYDLPTEEECRVVMEKVCRVPENIFRHCHKVAEVAGAIGRALLAGGARVDLPAVRGAALLHDMAKGQPEHDVAAGKQLRAMGFERIAPAVAAHTDLAAGVSPPSLVTKLLFLADKLVMGEAVVRVEERFKAAEIRYGADPVAGESVRKRLRTTLETKNEFERILGRPLETVLPG
jgi:molybdenum cofactor cytidylyltransferase